MRLNLAWLGLLLITSIFVYFTWYGYKILNTPVSIANEEGFANAQGIQITTCPAKSKMFINSAGLSLCCNGQVDSDVCSGDPICSLSESSKGIPTCSDWYAAYLREKGAGKCPANLPNYFESMDESKKGCTNGSLSRLGDSPADTNARKCIIYLTRTENLARKNSCLNTKYLDESSCFKSPPPTTTKDMYEYGQPYPTIVACKYGNPLSQESGQCYTESSFIRFIKEIYQYYNIDYSINEWKASSDRWNPYSKLQFCSVVEKHLINKTVSWKDLETVKVFD
jgi:hypothetical protein